MFETTLDRKALAEAYTIIRMLDKKILNKIPQNIVDAIRYNMDYKYEVDYSKLLNNELLDDTKKILSVIYTDYLASYEERDVIYKMENLKYVNNDDIFTEHKDKNVSIKSNTLNEKDKQELIEVQETKKESFIQKIISKIKRIFGRGN